MQKVKRQNIQKKALKQYKSLLKIIDGYPQGVTFCFFKENPNQYTILLMLQQKDFMLNRIPVYLSSQSVSICNFYQQLSLQLKQLQTMKMRGKKNYSPQSKLVLPDIGKKGRQKYAKSHHNTELQNRANQLQLRLYRLEKENQQFSKAKSKKNSQYIHYINKSIPDPYHYLTKGDGQENHQAGLFSRQQEQKQQVSIKKIKSDYILSESAMQNSKEKKYSKISEARRMQIKKRLRVVLIAVYFIPVFRVYSSSIFKKRCQRFVQIHGILSEESKQLETDFYQILIKLDLFELFYDISHSQESKTQQEIEKYQVKVSYEQDQVSINLKVCSYFLQHMLNQMKNSMDLGEFDIMYPILLGLMPGEFPFSKFFLEEELKAIRLNAKKGTLEISEQLSKMLIINFIFIKIILNKLLVERKVLRMILKKTKKKPGQKKLYVLYGKKLNITLILLYQTINSIFFSGIKKLNSNIEQLPQKVQILPRSELSFEFSSINFDQNGLSSKQQMLNLHLIKNIQCPQSLKYSFLTQFQKNWKQIREITDQIYQKMTLFQKEHLKMIKQSILSQGNFATVSNFSQILEWKNNLKIDNSKKRLKKQNTTEIPANRQKQKGNKKPDQKKLKK